MMRIILFVLVIYLFVYSALFAANPPPLVQNQFTYIGQPQNQTTQLLTLGGYRKYNPQTGRFLKQDSDSPFYSQNTFNGYDYAAGNPILQQDTNGHVSTTSQALSISVILFASLLTLTEALPMADRNTLIKFSDFNHSAEQTISAWQQAIEAAKENDYENVKKWLLSARKYENKLRQYLHVEDEDEHEFEINLFKARFDERVSTNPKLIKIAHARIYTEPTRPPTATFAPRGSCLHEYEHYYGDTGINKFIEIATRRPAPRVILNDASRI